ncbi:hypothetical protein J5N97_020382 [Dioscorea zingiberensis]|uniref:Uncharacterized protein n=1 Tax=Dioscorea zingiberensis TaxID=325984 RepID=A0A9D5HDR4_9LILI|nr:hypothetical protein J5N97_020382 [Dioscorea zingiberensis]
MWLRSARAAAARSRRKRSALLLKAAQALAAARASPTLGAVAITGWALDRLWRKPKCSARPGYAWADQGGARWGEGEHGGSGWPTWICVGAEEGPFASFLTAIEDYIRDAPTASVRKDKDFLWFNARRVRSRREGYPFHGDLRRSQSSFAASYSNGDEVVGKEPRPEDLVGLDIRNSRSSHHQCREHTSERYGECYIFSDTEE